jgi:hypothetical protein
MILPAKKNILMKKCNTDAEHKHHIDEGVLKEDEDEDDLWGFSRMMMRMILIMVRNDEDDDDY